MIDLHIPLSNRHYRYLQNRALTQGTTIETIVTELIDAEIAWRQALEDDPVAALFGKLEDTVTADEIDGFVYALDS